MTTTSSPDIVCARIAQRIAESVGSKRYSMWFDRSARFDYRDSEQRLELAVPSRFAADWIGRNFGREIREAAADELGTAVSLDVLVSPDLFVGETALPAAPPRRPGDAAEPLPIDKAPKAHVPGRKSQGRVTTRPGGKVRYTLDDFVIGKSNELAHGSACRLIDDVSEHTNPLFIHGGCGMGKTHLLHGICQRMLKKHPTMRVLYITAEQFTNEFLAAMQVNKVKAFRDRIRRVDLLAIDDLQFLANKTATQQEFLHSFDAIVERGARVVLAATCYPKELPKFSEALVSRCMRGMVAPIAEPDTSTRARIVQALAVRRGMPLIDTVIDVIASRCAGSVREIEGTLTKLHALATLTQGGTGLSESGKTGVLDAGRKTVIGHALVNRLFSSDHQPARKTVIKFEAILNEVAQEFAVTREQIMGNGRHRLVVLARSLTIYLARTMTSKSFPEIAAAMGRNSHSTIITAAQRVEKQLKAKQKVVLPQTLEEVSLLDVIERLRHRIAGTA